MRFQYLSKSIMIISLAVIGCSGVDNRYKDTVDLERPPQLPIDKLAAEQIAANQFEPQKKRHGKGLKKDVSLLETSPTELIIQRTFDESWGLFNQAVLLNDIKIADQDRSKGVYYLTYSGGGLLSSATSFFDKDNKGNTYLIKLEGHGETTQVKAQLANKDEQISATSPLTKQDHTEDVADNSQKLMALLFATLRDDVKDE